VACPYGDTITRAQLHNGREVAKLIKNTLPQGIIGIITTNRKKMPPYVHDLSSDDFALFTDHVKRAMGFLRSDRLYATNISGKGVGVVAYKDIKGGEPLTELNGEYGITYTKNYEESKFYPSQFQSVVKVGKNTSLLTSPISLLNYACLQHANTVQTPLVGKAFSYVQVSFNDIHAGEELTYYYSNEFSNLSCSECQ
jgi:hypothetical protein